MRVLLWNTAGPDNDVLIVAVPMSEPPPQEASLAIEAVDAASPDFNCARWQGWNG